MTVAGSKIKGSKLIKCQKWMLAGHLPGNYSKFYNFLHQFKGLGSNILQIVGKLIRD
jgi:hypothetical protein